MEEAEIEEGKCIQTLENLSTASCSKFGARLSSAVAPATAASIHMTPCGGSSFSAADILLSQEQFPCEVEMAMLNTTRVHFSSW